jgi:hypothetical protein
MLTSKKSAALCTTPVRDRRAIIISVNRRSFLCAATIAGTQSLVSRTALAQPTQSRPSHKNPESTRRIEHATTAALALQRRDWEQGILAQAMLQSGQREKLIQLTKAAMVQQTPDGRMGVVVSGGPTDPAMGGAAYAQAAKWTGAPEMR